MHHRVEDAEQDKFAPGSVGFHEMVDRASCVLENWNSFVLEHQACQRNPKLTRLGRQIGALMHDYFQMSSFIDMKDDPEIGGSDYCKEFVSGFDAAKRLAEYDEKNYFDEDERHAVPFVEAFMKGDAEVDHIDDYVQAWHRNGKQATLREALGFSDDEYKAWAEDPYAFEDQLEKRRKGMRDDSDD